MLIEELVGNPRLSGGDVTPASGTSGELGTPSTLWAGRRGLGFALVLLKVGTDPLQCLGGEF